MRYQEYLRQIVNITFIYSKVIINKIKIIFISIFSLFKYCEFFFSKKISIKSKLFVLNLKIKMKLSLNLAKVKKRV